MSFVDPAFFSDFATDLTVNGVAARGIFEQPFASAFNGMVDGSGPLVHVPSSVVAKRGDPVVIGPVSFIVRAVEPDGTGLTVLRLDEV